MYIVHCICYKWLIVIKKKKIMMGRKLNASLIQVALALGYSFSNLCVFLAICKVELEFIGILHIMGIPKITKVSLKFYKPSYNCANTISFN